MESKVGSAKPFVSLERKLFKSPVSPRRDLPQYSYHIQSLEGVREAGCGRYVLSANMEMDFKECHLVPTAYRD